MAISRRMLIDATHNEETRVAVVDQNLRLEHLDIVHAGREPLKGNIYLAKVRRIEPSLQAAFVEYDDKGVKRHGFLSFAEIHPDYFKIPVADRDAMRAALAKIEAQAEEAAARGETIDIDRLTGVIAGETDLSGSDLAYDPLQPISLSEDEDDADDFEGGFQDTFHKPAMAAATISDRVSTADDSDSDEDDADEESDIEDSADDESGEEMGEEVGEGEETAAKAAPRKSYETVGGDDDLEERRRRIRRQFLRNYRIQEVIKRGQVMLIQVVKEERGNKGAALTTYLSLAGRYCVLMPNSDKAGGVSRKISNPGDRKRLKETLESFGLPEGMSVILRTAGVERAPDEIKRDFDYLVRLWDQIRDLTMHSVAPALIYEEANLIKRAIRDYFTQGMDGVVVEGEAGFKLAQDFMKLLMPTHADRVVRYENTVPLFTRYQIETQIEQLYEPVAQLKSGGYLVINPTEALVSIDVNSGRATRDRHIEETALRTNLEAAEEVARQLRLRDLAGLVVIDFIDMEENRHNQQVERKLKESMKNDRARLQIGRISGFGLMELSRQRLRPSLLETNFEKCPHCEGTGHIRSADSAALAVLRAIEDEGLKQKAAEIAVDVPKDVALYILNEKREVLSSMESRYDFRVYLRADDQLLRHEFSVERLENRTTDAVIRVPSSDTRRVFTENGTELGLAPLSAADLEDLPQGSRVRDDDEEDGEGNGNRRSRGGRNRRGGRDRGERQPGERAERGERTERNNQENRGRTRPQPDAANDQDGQPVEAGDEQGEGSAEGATDANGERRRRGRRGGRRRGPLGMRDRGERGERPNGDQPAGERQPGDRPQGDRPQGERQYDRQGGDRQPRPPQDRGALPHPTFDGRTVVEIDTTPKPHVHTPSSSTTGGTPNDGEPKSGWWRRWTGG